MLLAGAEIGSIRRGLSYTLRTGITLMVLFTIVVLLPFFCPVAKYPIPTPISHPYLRRAVPTSNDACAEERVSPAHESDSSSTTCKMAATAVAAEVVAGIAAAAVGCCSCCCADPATRPAAAQQQQLYVRHRGRQQLAVYTQITGRTGRVLYAHYRTQS